MKIRLKIINILFAALLLTGFNSCVIEKEIETITTVTTQPQGLVTTSIHGKVIDENGRSISDARVSLESNRNGTRLYTTDRNGNFEFLFYENQGHSAYLRVEAAGYFEGHRRLSVVRNNFNFSQIMLLPKKLAGTISSQTGGTVASADDMQVKLVANSVVFENGQPYTGQVNVYMAWVDPSSPNLPDMMIGDLSGIASDGNPASLSTFGMVHVELEDENGQLVNIAEGKSAELSYPIPTSRLVEAPPTIPLWSYEKEAGLWIEESVALLDVDRYIGEVSHFSSWNVDFMSDPISINGCVNISSSGNRSANFRGRILVCSNLIGQKGGWLCPDGKFLFYNFPVGEVFTLKILGDCGDVVFEQQYGPYDVDSDLGTLEVMISDPLINSITGLATNCAGDLIANGYVRGLSDNDHLYFAEIVDGEFVLNFLTCVDISSLSLVVYDRDANLSSDNLIAELVNGVLDVGTIEVCNLPSTFITFNLVGHMDETFFEPTIVFGGDTSLITVIGKLGLDSELHFTLLFDNLPTSVGTYESSIHTFNYLTQVSSTFSSGSPSTPSNMTVVITEYGSNAGDFILGSYSGTAFVWDGQTGLGDIPLSGTFKIIRD